MLKVLVPVDGSAASLRAVEHTIKFANSCPVLEVVLLNVQAPSDSWELRSHLRQSEIEAMQVSKGGDALDEARRRFEAAGISCTPEVAMGPVAATIVDYARSHGCDGIIMGNKGETFLEEITIGSVAHDVLRHSAVPVTFIK
jgi:nucleotide-binding universal stress UspA family protein